MLKQELRSPSRIDARALLQEELLRRCQKNPKYSLRAFAKALGLSPAILSLVLAGKRPVSRKTIEKASQALGLSPVEKQSLLHRKLGVPSSASVAGDFQQISLDTFSLLSDWQNYAILSLLETRGSRLDPAWIAKRLSIAETQAKLSIDLLVRLGLIEEKTGKWRQSGKPLKVENMISTPATRKFHRQLLERAIESLENDPAEVRDFTSMTLAMDPEHMPYARERIQSFRRELTRELEEMGPSREVYNFTLQLYPVSKSMKQAPRKIRGEGK